MFKERTEKDADACWVITVGRLWSPQRRPVGQRRSLLPPGGSDGRGYRALSRTVVRERPSFRRALLEARLRTLERQAPVGPSRVATRPGVCGADRALARAGDRQRRSVSPTLSTSSAGVAPVLRQPPSRRLQGSDCAADLHSGAIAPIGW